MLKPFAALLAAGTLAQTTKAMGPPWTSMPERTGRAQDGFDFDFCSASGAKRCGPLGGIENQQTSGQRSSERCDGFQDGETCTPKCVKGYEFCGKPAMCRNGTWDISETKCSRLGVHRVGVGVHVLNVADVNLKAGSFIGDFVLTILTETKPFDTYENLMMTFDADGDLDLTEDEMDKRECSPNINWATGKDLEADENLVALYGSHTPLGTGEGNSYYAQTPKQFLGRDTPTEPYQDKLGLEFLNLDGGGSRRRIHEIRYNGLNTGKRIRVQGLFFFQPELDSWPFDTQRLDITFEALMGTVHTDPTFIFCHMSTYSGLAETIRYPDANTQLTFRPRIREHCWPPFADPTNNKGDCDGDFGCSAEAARTCETNFNPFRKPETEGVDLSSVHDAFSCNCKGGLYSSSRYTGVVSCTSPVAQRFVKNVLPVVFIVFINAVIHTVHWSLHTQRVNTCVGSLTALVLFHVSLINQLPPSPRLTSADSLMLSAYALNFVTWCFVLGLVLLTQGKHRDQAARDAKAEKVWQFFRFLGPSIAFSVMVCEISTMLEAAMSEDSPSSTGRIVVWAFVVPIVCPAFSIGMTRLLFGQSQATRQHANNDINGEVEGGIPLTERAAASGAKTNQKSSSSEA